MNTVTLASHVAAPPAGTGRPQLRQPPAWRLPVIVAVVCAVAGVLLPDQLGLLTRMAGMALLVLSVDLVVGYAGLATLGQAAMFGIGAYAAGLTALKFSADPLVGLACGALAGAVTAGLSGLFLLRYQGFTFLMLTIAVAQILQSVASKARSLTGGDDGLSGFFMAPLFGRIEFDLEGRTAFFYTAGVLVLVLYALRRLVNSPFGLSVQGIHQSRARMSALGTAIVPQLWRMYVIAGAVAGVAGALSAQGASIVGLDALSFSLSAEALVMLVLGGSGRLGGALVGTVIFMVLHHTAASVNPYHWLFVIGALLMVVVLLPQGWPQRIAKRWKR
jgi:branched-chain amino acid transport system permease protein